MIKAVTLHYLNLEIKAYNLFAFLFVFSCNGDAELSMRSTQLSLKSFQKLCNGMA